jgi:hypothetical protein
MQVWQPRTRRWTRHNSGNIDCCSWRQNKSSPKLRASGTIASVACSSESFVFQPTTSALNHKQATIDVREVSAHGYLPPIQETHLPTVLLSHGLPYCCTITKPMPSSGCCLVACFMVTAQQWVYMSHYTIKMQCLDSWTIQCATAQLIRVITPIKC